MRIENYELFNVVGLIDQIVAIGGNSKFLADGFVEGALPPLVKGVAVPAQSF